MLVYSEFGCQLKIGKTSVVIKPGATVDIAPEFATMLDQAGQAVIVKDDYEENFIDAEDLENG